MDAITHFAQGLPKEWQRILSQNGITETEMKRNPKEIMQIVGFYQENTADRAQNEVWHKFENARANDGGLHDSGAMTPSLTPSLTPSQLTPNPMMSPPQSPRFPRNGEDSFENPRAAPPVPPVCKSLRINPLESTLIAFPTEPTEWQLAAATTRASAAGQCRLVANRTDAPRASSACAASAADATDAADASGHRPRPQRPPRRHIRPSDRHREHTAVAKPVQHRHWIARPVQPAADPVERAALPAAAEPGNGDGAAALSAAAAAAREESKPKPEPEPETGAAGAGASAGAGAATTAASAFAPDARQPTAAVRTSL
ncbi:MAG: hypothetical protein INR71_05880 [Terriglobus roseus]|nr:hypothetical protein [Terriglobus roseus]